MRRALAAALVLAFGAAGCASSPTPTLDAFATNTGGNSFEVFGRSVEPEASLVLPVVHDRQTSGPSCGAHAIASVINYWRDDASAHVSGDAIFRQTPPAQPSGYSMAELMALANQHGLLSSSVRLPPEGLIAELENGRPVLVPVRLPSIYVQPQTLPGDSMPVIGFATSVLTHRVGRLSEWTGLTMVDHYLLVVGYEDDTFVVVEPVRGYRTISADKLERYRDHFGEAAIVFSADPEAPPMHTAGTGANEG